MGRKKALTTAKLRPHQLPDRSQPSTLKKQMTAPDSKSFFGSFLPSAPLSLTSALREYEPRMLHIDKVAIAAHFFVSVPCREVLKPTDTQYDIPCYVKLFHEASKILVGGTAIRRNALCLAYLDVWDSQYSLVLRIFLQSNFIICARRNPELMIHQSLPEEAGPLSVKLLCRYV